MPENIGKIAHTVIGPAHPGAHFHLVARGIELGAADRLFIPWEALHEDPIVFDGVVKAAETYLDLHTGETIHMFSRPGFAQTAGKLFDALYEYGRSRAVPVKVRSKTVEVLEVRPTAIIYTCGDGRPWFWRSLIELYRQFGYPWIITPPGEEQWLRDHPEVARRLEDWADTQARGLPRIVVKHSGHCGQGCGYRHAHGFRGSPHDERQAALAECTRNDTHYLWQPGQGEVYFEDLQLPAHVRAA